MSLEWPRGCVERCPGCSHRTLTFDQSLAQKADFLGRMLSPWAQALEPVRTVGPTERFGYRGKICVRAQRNAAGLWRFGLLRRDREGNEEVIDIPDCPIHSAFVRDVLKALARVLPADGDFPLSFVLISGRFLTLVLKARGLGSTDWPPDWIGGLRPAELGLSGIFANLNPVAGDRVLSHRGWRLLWGQERDRFRLERIFPGRDLYYGPDSFSQLIPSLYQDSLAEAESFLGVEPEDIVVDLYSGIGISLSLWSSAGARALGVELGEESVACAELNAGAGASLRGRASERLPQLSVWAREQSQGRRLAYANPPRLGLEPEVLRWIVEEFRPARFAYLSCSAGTLARDLLRLTEADYSVRRIVPYDFFPGTSHVESLVCLERSGKILPT